MPGFLASLSFLYLFTALLMGVYGLYYYRNFIRNGYQPRLFPWLFLLLFGVCLSMLWMKFQPLKHSATYSNLDHHFLKHTGYRVNQMVVLGRTDSTNRGRNNYNEFRISKSKGQYQVLSAYSEEPLYNTANGVHQLLSASWPATGHTLSFQTDAGRVSLYVRSADHFELRVNGQTAGSRDKKVKRAIQAQVLFQDDTLFASSGYMADERLTLPLQHIYLLRQSFSGKDSGQLHFYVSSRIFHTVEELSYDQQPLQAASTAFSAGIPAGSHLGWGAGYPERNRNQYRLQDLGADSFRLSSLYPLAYPLTEEKTSTWGEKREGQSILKFLVADAAQISRMPAVLEEGFLFAAFPGDSTFSFSPLILSCIKERAGQPVQLAAYEAGTGRSLPIRDQRLLVPARQAGLTWEFALEDSFNWQLGNRVLTATQWQWLITGSLFFYFLLVFGSAFIKAPNRVSWVWQVLSAVSLVLLTTRFLLYWRYKSFPPFEGLDSAAIQQLNSPWNFGVILLTTLLLGGVFGFDLIRLLYQKTRGWLDRKYRYRQVEVDPYPHFPAHPELWPGVRRAGVRTGFWSAWVLVLGTGAGFAFIRHFDPSVCRHLAIGLVLLYFLFTYTATRFSPLVTAAEESWWQLNSSRKLEMLIANPARLLISVSLLALFAFMDIGFALIFINYLLFNETFLLLNHSIAGLSAGSRGNAVFFGILAALFGTLFSLNLLFGPYIFRFILSLPSWIYVLGYALLALLVSYATGRLLRLSGTRKRWLQLMLALSLFGGLTLFVPKERIMEKAAMTRYRIDVLTMPAAEAIEKAYQEGDQYEPVIRAAQNQWFINSFTDADNNPGVNDPAFRLLPHAPQNRGARYNAQATDLVTSRFMMAEHGNWSVLFYMLLLLLPLGLLASFYRLYPDFTSRINPGYAAVTTGFSLLNYLLVTALLVVLAATGRYIFFGQDLPFASILSKQSILFPSGLIIAVVIFFRKIPLQQYPNRLKMLPGIFLFTGLLILLFLVKPVFNREKDFGVKDLAATMDAYIREKIQPLLDEIDTAAATRRLPLARKDRLFTTRLQLLSGQGAFRDAPAVLQAQLQRFGNSGFSAHLDANRLLYIDLNTGKPVLSANDHFFHVEAPPHVQQSWCGGVWGDSNVYNISLYQTANGTSFYARLDYPDSKTRVVAAQGLIFVYRPSADPARPGQIALVNGSEHAFRVEMGRSSILLPKTDTLVLSQHTRYQLFMDEGQSPWLLAIEPDAFMKNYAVNGSRFYHYPLAAGFIWARNFAEGIAGGYAGKDKRHEQVYLSMAPSLTDTLNRRIREMMDTDTAFRADAEYGICIADGTGRIWAMPDHIKGFQRPDPNQKSAFSQALRGNNGFISQSYLRKLTGNLNLLRMNPGPGSTLKPIVFSAIASQLPLDWDAFASEGFDRQQSFFGGEKVAPYDFEKNNGRISSVKDYIRYSDNYYHSNLLLLGSYNRQELQAGLLGHFTREKPTADVHWPWFIYQGQSYWLNGFENWPGYQAGKASFGSDSSFVSLGLNRNFNIYTTRTGRGYEPFRSRYDSLVMGKAAAASGFILPELALFDQKAGGMHPDKPNELFMSAFRGHVKGSSQVMIPPLKMLDAFGKLVSQDRNYFLTLNPEGNAPQFASFEVDSAVGYARYLGLLRESLFPGMREALYSGTAARLGNLLKNQSPYFYYAKTGTTGDDEQEVKSKLFTIIISEKDISSRDFNFRDNRFVVVYFTSQKGPARQQEAFQAAVIRMLENTAMFRKYMRPRAQ